MPFYAAPSFFYPPHCCRCITTDLRYHFTHPSQKKKTSHCGCDISAMFALAYAPKNISDNHYLEISWENNFVVNVCDDSKSVGHFCETWVGKVFKYLCNQNYCCWLSLVKLSCDKVWEYVFTYIWNIYKKKEF